MKRLTDILFLTAAVFCCVSCDWFSDEKETKLENVMILYSAGFNSLSDDLVRDIDELKEGSLPSRKDKQAVIIVNHCTESYLSYNKPTRPAIIRLYKDSKRGPILDTLTTLPETSLLTDPEVIADALNFIAEKFKSEKYGLIFSSHGTGWLPAGYYASPDKYDGTGGGDFFKTQARNRRNGSAVPYAESNMPGPRVKTFGEEIFYENNVRMSYETSIQDLAKALPCHFDYIFFDACLMGGVEVAYELKDKCDYLGFSQAEMLADGLEYTKITTHLLKSGDPDFKGVADDYYETYEGRYGDYKSATFSIVKCSEIDNLAGVCKGLFDKYADKIASVNPSEVQQYFRSYHHWFYDLEDILAKSGASKQDMEDLHSAIDNCMYYKVCTEYFMPSSGGFQINTFSGLSMYLPCNGSPYLDAYYKTYGWNRATALVK